VTRTWGVDGLEDVTEGPTCGGQKFAVTTEGPHYGEIFVLKFEGLHWDGILILILGRLHENHKGERKHLSTNYLFVVGSRGNHGKLIDWDSLWASRMLLTYSQQPDIRMHAV
jgi:hypothetical protein